MYTNPSLTDNDIPHKSTMAAAVDAKVEKLDVIDINALRVSKSASVILFLCAHPFHPIYFLAD
jgi:hypothetical protein